MRETWAPEELARADWSQAEMDFEQETEAFVDLLARGHFDDAGDVARRTAILARQSFQANDPRRGTALANHGLGLALAGLPGSDRLLAEAMQVWSSCGGWIADLAVPQRARSSIFHMRMEQRHRETYRQNWRRECELLVDEAIERLGGVEVEQSIDEVAARASLEHWQRERPARLTDGRRLLAAVRLLLPGACVSGQARNHASDRAGSPSSEA